MGREKGGQTKEEEERREGGRNGGREGGREGREAGRGGYYKLEDAVKILARKHCGLRCGALPMFKSDLFLVRISTSVTKNPHSWEFCKASSRDGEMARERHNT